MRSLRKTFALLPLMAAAATGSACAQTRPAAGPLDGIFYGIRVNMMSDSPAPIQEFFTFLPDGRVFGGDPQEGLGRPIVWERECHVARCGTYTFRDGQVTVQWGPPSSRTEVLRLDAQGVLRTTAGSEHSFRKLQLPQGPIEGTYQRTMRDGTPISSITFGRDGRFSEQGLLHDADWDDFSPENRAAMVDSGSGSYTLGRGTLTLRYDGGPTAHLLMTVRPGADPRRRITISRTDLDRKP